MVYDEPFWRGDGFSGQPSEPGSASEVTLDAAERRRAVLGSLAARFGPRRSSGRFHRDAVVERSGERAAAEILDRDR